MDTPAYLAAALYAGLTISDLYRLPTGWVMDIIAIKTGKYRDIVQAEDMEDSDFFGGI